jgi:hypothetical protein
LNNTEEVLLEEKVEESDEQPMPEISSHEEEKIGEEREGDEEKTPHEKEGEVKEVTNFEDQISPTAEQDSVSILNIDSN